MSDCECAATLQVMTTLAAEAVAELLVLDPVRAREAVRRAQEHTQRRHAEVLRSCRELSELRRLEIEKLWAELAAACAMAYAATAEDGRPAGVRVSPVRWDLGNSYICGDPLRSSATETPRTQSQQSSRKAVCRSCGGGGEVSDLQRAGDPRGFPMNCPTCGGTGFEETPDGAAEGPPLH